MKVIRFDWQSAYMAGVKGHPQTVVKEMGVNVLAYEACGIGGCSFMEVDKLPDPMPTFIEESEYQLII